MATHVSLTASEGRMSFKRIQLTVLKGSVCSYNFRRSLFLSLQQPCNDSLTNLSLHPLPRAAYLLPFRFVLRLQLLTGHVAAEASLDLGGGPVGFGIIQGDVHDILFLLGPAAILLLRRANHRGFSLKRMCASPVPWLGNREGC